MPLNSENPTARLLYAILKQKDLRDIDWDRVARDPVLIEPITNGHAARMRYSRFQTSVRNTQPQSSSRLGDNTRVRKGKRRPRPREVAVKSEVDANTSCAEMSPASVASPNFGGSPLGANTRFLTPCSDDMSYSITAHPEGQGFCDPMNLNLGNQAIAPMPCNSTTYSPELSPFPKHEHGHKTELFNAVPTDHSGQIFNDPGMTPFMSPWNEHCEDQALF